MRALAFVLLSSPLLSGVAWGLTTAGSYLDLGGEQFFSQAADPEVDSSFSRLGLGLKAGWVLQPLGLETLVEVDGQLALDSSQQNYLAVPELYVLWVDREGVSQDVSLEVSLGRRKHLWSVLDDEWKLGLWQPLARWDELDRKTQGFAGLFVRGGARPFSANLMLSPIFIPDQGAQSELEDGRVSSQSRWFRPPPRQMIPLGEEQTEIHYEVAMPSLTEILSQFSFVGQLKWQQEQGKGRGHWISLNVADKPLNQIQLPFEGVLDIAASSDYGLTRVVIHPRVYRHRLAGVEWGYGSEGSQLWASLTREWVETQDLPGEWFFSPPSGGVYPGLGFRQNWAFWGLPGIDTRISYVGFWEDESSLQLSTEGDAGGLAQQGSARHPFQEALTWGLSSLWSWSESQSLRLGLDHTYSFSERGSLLSLSLRAQTQPGLFWSLGLDLLGAGAQPVSEGGLISQYRHNDRVRAGVTYVF